MNEIRTEFTLWAIPSGDVYRTLKKTIEALSGQYGAPIFEPHVAILGEIFHERDHTLSLTSNLARNIEPYKICLEKPQRGTNYFNSVYLKVVKDSSVMRANILTREAFGRHDDPEYHPYLSLIYGNFTPEQKKMMIGSVNDHLSNLEFDVDRIHVYSSLRDPSDPNRRDFIKEAEFRLF